jgi:integrase
MHNDFTLFMRTYPNGTKVVFYHTYDENGKRVGPWTTNCINKTAARNYCHKLLKAGELIPNKTKAVTFGSYADGFWERGSEYIRNQDSRANITDAYISNCRKYVANQLMPFFADTPLGKIADRDINNWLLGFKNRKVVRDGKEKIMNYQNTYANTVFGTLNVMLAEAVRRGLIPSNPCDKVRRLKNDRKKLEILTVEEVHRLFPDNYKTVWGDQEIAYTANRLASLTGMRIGEIMGLRGEFVFESHILVCGQYGEFGYGETKTKSEHNIPLLPEMIALLRKLMKANGNGFIFSLDGGATPVSYSYIRRDFFRALKKIGIDETEAGRRGLSLHGWRHFLNTDLLVQGLTVEQVQSVTGHLSKSMTKRRYNHMDARQIADVIKAQEVIFGKKQAGKSSPPKEPEKGRGKKKPEGLEIVKRPNQKTA